MADARILIVGAGVAGLNAACELAEAGHDALVVDHAPTIGGAIFRQALSAAPHKRVLPARRERQWRALAARVAAAGKRIEIRTGVAFAGIDYRGTALVTPLDGGPGLMLRPRALIVATGATEIVRPRKGWTLNGVTSVGALQVGLKMSGHTPRGRIVLAGSGALLYAAGAQLARAGNPPLAIIEAGRPFDRPWRGAGLPVRYLAEAAGYMARLAAMRVPILTGAWLREIERTESGLALHVARGGRDIAMEADHLGLHDGLKRNDLGVTPPEGLPVRLAGDCNLCLGADAAATDGRNAALDIMSRIDGADRSGQRLPVDAERRAQARLAAMFAHDRNTPLAALSPDTVLCRCEGATVADLERLRRGDADAAETVREVRLSGRFGMGPCQGRFCLDAVSELLGGEPSAEALRGNRWPARPIPVSAFIDAIDETRD